MDIDTLIDDYLGCRANKRRSVDSARFELHWERDLARLLEDVNARTLEPFLYSFIRQKPRPREVVAALMPMKIIQYHFDLRTRPLVERELTDRTFNNRVGYGVDRAVERLRRDILEVSKGYTRDCWIITRDIRAYFPSTDLARSYDKYRALVEANFPEGEERDDLLYILMRVNYAYPQIHARLKSPRHEYDDIIAAGKSVVFNTDDTRGAGLGAQFWQVQKNYDLADFDRWQVVVCGMRYIRFVDDMAWVVDNKEAGLAHVAHSERLLMEREGYEMHPRKRYCQHYTKGVRLLGVHIKFGRVYTDDRTVRNCRMAIRRRNRRPSPSRLGGFLASVNSYLGLLKRRDNYAVIRDLVDEVSPEWWRYCLYDDERRCLVAGGCYKHNEILKRKYHFRFNKDKRRRHDRTGETGQDQRPGVGAA